MRRYAVRIAVLATTAVTLSASRAMAQGFGVYEHDACTMARAGAGVAAPCNASAVFYNPAGIVVPSSPTKWNLAIGATSIGADFAFQDSVTGTTTNSTGGAVFVPNVHITYQMNPRWAFGFGVFAPYGLVSEWPSAGFQGRFLGYRSELKSIYFQPTAAWQVKPWLRIGAGFDYIRSTVDLKQRVDLAANVAQASTGTTFGQLGIPAGTDFADAHLTGSSYSAGAHFGILLNPTDRVAIGMRYLLRAKADIQGDASFTQLPTGILLPAGSPLQPSAAGTPCLGHVPLDTLRRAAGLPLDDVLECNNIFNTTLKSGQHASTNVPLPDQFVIGFEVKMTDKLRVMGDFQWVNWSKFQTLQITFLNAGTRVQYEDYNDTHALRVGGEYDLTPKITLRGGLLYHEGAAPAQTVTPLLPEAERAEQTLGLGFRISTHGRIDLAYQHINQADRRGRVVDAPRGPGGAAFNTGVYTGNANLFGASLAWGF